MSIKNRIYNEVCTVYPSMCVKTTLPPKNQPVGDKGLKTRTSQVIKEKTYKEKVNATKPHPEDSLKPKEERDLDGMTSFFIIGGLIVIYYLQK